MFLFLFWNFLFNNATFAYLNKISKDLCKTVVLMYCTLLVLIMLDLSYTVFISGVL